MANSSKRDTIQLSKTLSYLLRHGSKEKKLEMDSDGYSKLNDVLDVLSAMLPRQKITKTRIFDIVQNCPKQRFKLSTVDGVEVIRANQGHSLQDVKSTSLKVVDHFDEGPKGKIIHGTTSMAWESIKKSGLNRMTRNHIHMAKGEFGEAKSGARFSSEIIITIDGNKAIADRILFYESDNGVILSPGNENGIIHPRYFLNVYNIKRKLQLFP